MLLLNSFKKSSSIADIHAPMREINVKENPPAWVNGNYLAHVDERKYLAKVYKKQPTAGSLENKIDWVQRTYQLHLSLQHSFFREAIERHKGDMKRTWQTIKCFWPYLNKGCAAANSNAGLSASEKANLFNDHFTTVGQKLASTIPDSPGLPLDFQAEPPVFDLEELATVSSS